MPRFRRHSVKGCRDVTAQGTLQNEWVVVLSRRYGVHGRESCYFAQVGSSIYQGYSTKEVADRICVASKNMTQLPYRVVGGIVRVSRGGHSGRGFLKYAEAASDEDVKNLKGMLPVYAPRGNGAPSRSAHGHVPEVSMRRPVIVEDLPSMLPGRKRRDFEEEERLRKEAAEQHGFVYLG